MDNRDYSNYDYCPPKSGRENRLARAYVPYQVMGKVFKPREALCKGTLFPELYMPYKYGKENRKK